MTAADGSGKKATCTVKVTESTVPAEPVSEQLAEPEKSKQPDGSEKTLVVYFGTPVQDRSGQVDGISSTSRTVTGKTYKGNTEYISEMISRETGADLFEIVPENAYAEVYETVRDLAQQGSRMRVRRSKMRAQIFHNTIRFMSDTLKWSKVFAVYSVYHVKIQLNIATQYTKHRKKCECSKWEIYNDWQGEGVLHMPVFY